MDIVYVTTEQMLALISQQLGESCRQVVKDCLDACVFMTMESILHQLNGLLASCGTDILIQIVDVYFDSDIWVWKVQIGPCHLTDQIC